MSDEATFFICAAIVLCTMIGCCTYQQTQCAKFGMRATAEGCVEKKP